MDLEASLWDGWREGEVGEDCQEDGFNKKNYVEVIFFLKTERALKIIAIYVENLPKRTFPTTIVLAIGPAIF